MNEIKKYLLLRFQIVGVSIFIGLICIGGIEGLKNQNIKGILFAKNLDTVLAVLITLIFLTSIVLLLHTLKVFVKKTDVVVLISLTLIGFFGLIICFAEVYSLHGLVCGEKPQSASDIPQRAGNIIDCIRYSFNVLWIGEPPSFCKPVEAVDLVTDIEFFVTWIFLTVCGAAGLHELWENWWGQSGYENK